MPLRWSVGPAGEPGHFLCGVTVNLTADADLSAHYWTPICTGTVSYTAAGDCNIADSQTLEGVIFNGNGHTITGLTTQTGVRGASRTAAPATGRTATAMPPSSAITAAT